jgi:hypothetical protein
MACLLDVISSRGPGNLRFPLSYPIKWRTKFLGRISVSYAQPRLAERGKHGIYLIDDTRNTTFKKLKNDNKRALPAFFQLQHSAQLGPPPHKFRVLRQIVTFSEKGISDFEFTPTLLR